MDSKAATMTETLFGDMMTRLTRLQQDDEEKTIQTQVAMAIAVVLMVVVVVSLCFASRLDSPGLYQSMSKKRAEEKKEKKNYNGNMIQLVCPYAPHSTFFIQPQARNKGNHTIHPLDDCDLNATHDYLGLRWLVAGKSGQDVPGRLRAQLQPLTTTAHHHHFLVVDPRHFVHEFQLKQAAFAQTNNGGGNNHHHHQQHPEIFVMEPLSLDAQQETLELFTAFLTQRYPHIYQYNQNTHSLTVQYHESLSFPSSSCSEESSNVLFPTTFRLDDWKNRPLELCARLVQEDLVLIRQNDNNDDDNDHDHDDSNKGASTMRTTMKMTTFTLTAAAVAFSFADLRRKLGQPLDWIHRPVPGYNHHGNNNNNNSDNSLSHPHSLHKVVQFALARLQSEIPYWRNNWTIVPSGRIDEPSDSTEYSQTLEQQYYEDQEEDDVDNNDTNKKFKMNVLDRYLKMEYQTIRRLPRNSRYLLFTVHTFCEPISALTQVSPTAAATLAASIRNMMQMDHPHHEHQKQQEEEAEDPHPQLEYRGIESNQMRDILLNFLDAIAQKTSTDASTTTFEALLDPNTGDDSTKGHPTPKDKDA